MQDHSTAERRDVASMLALAIGIVYTLIGLAGFLVTGFDNFAKPTDDETLLGLELNPLHNLAHLGVGLLGLVAWRNRRLLATYGWTLAAIFTVLFVYGLVVGDDTNSNILALNPVDDVIHAATAAAGLVIAKTAGASRGARAPMRQALAGR